MAKIIKLDTLTANRIAAGEVIERVASVVKELVENSLDAEAKSIKISLEESGLKEIVVSDDGSGMDYQDAKLAIEQHATSKIKTGDDLFNIHTLGFRGEALPSIVSVSHFKLKTSVDGYKGFMYSLKGGVFLSEAAVAFSKGTEITVRNLFFNTPARLQNLGTANSELSYITEYVTKMAIARPDVSFTLVNNNKTIFQSYGNNDPLEVIMAAYDTSVAKDMASIFNNNGYFKISGYISKGQVARSSKNHITLCVNGRIVRNSNIINGIVTAYSNYLVSGRYPIVFLQIDVDYALVDVNIHPAKLEVRFSREDELIDLIVSTITKRLEKVEFIPNITFNEEEVKSSEIQIESYQEKKDFQDVATLSTLAETIGFSESTASPLIYNESLVEKKATEELFLQQEYNLMGDDSIKETIESLPKMHYLGQLFGTYIIAQAEDAFFLIDQHAANERINYEKILKEIQKEDIKTYELLIPLKLDFSLPESLLIREKMSIFNNLSLYLEDFGSGSFTLRVLPTWIPSGYEKEFVEGIITEVIAGKKREKWEFLDEIAKSLACKKSIKANEFKSLREVEYLLNDLTKAKNPYTCPHGRPVIIKFTKYELERWFKRVL